MPIVAGSKTYGTRTYGVSSKVSRILYGYSLLKVGVNLSRNIGGLYRIGVNRLAPAWVEWEFWVPIYPLVIREMSPYLGAQVLEYPMIQQLVDDSLDVQLSN